MKFLATEPAAGLLCVALAAFAPCSFAQGDPADCVGITDGSARLACYDAAMGRTATSGPAPVVDADTPRNAVFARDLPPAAARATEPAADARSELAEMSLLDRRWELFPESKLGPFHIRAYRPVYLLPFLYTNRVNRLPQSPAPDHQVTTPLDIDRLEAKYQLSLKTKIWEDILGDNGDLWMGYTQTSHWQIYNDDVSRPFRETTYNPDASFIWRTDYDVLGWNGRLLGVTLDHQSNGRSKPFSRSWNRIMLDIGLDRDGWALMLRPWWRVGERDSIDDNPDIADYHGRADLQLVHERNGHEFALMARHSLRGGERSHGAVQFDWAFPIREELRGHVQLFDGYGESLIDYNHRAWYFGIGVSLLEWY
jgi:phospholipase A1